jgi:hypothetical protein
VLGIDNNEPDAVFHFLDEYVESVCIEEHQGGDSTWSEDLACSESSVHEYSGSTASSVVGITSKELEPFNELIKFDHMYFRQPSKDADTLSVKKEKSLNQSEIESCEVVSELTSTSETAELASDEDLNLSSFSESDLAQLTNCLDWWIDSSSDGVTENKSTVLKCQDNTSSMASLDDIESMCLPEQIDSLVPFTDDSFISTIYFDSSFDTQNSYNSTFDSNYEKMSGENLLKNDMTKDVVEHKKYSESDSTLFIDSVKNCSSPSSSSGCESDFSSSTYEDEPFSFSTDIGLMDLSDEPFTELFPALY